MYDQNFSKIVTKNKIPELFSTFCLDRPKTRLFFLKLITLLNEYAYY